MKVIAFNSIHSEHGFFMCPHVAHLHLLLSISQRPQCCGMAGGSDNILSTQAVSLFVGWCNGSFVLPQTIHLRTIHKHHPHENLCWFRYVCRKSLLSSVSRRWSWWWWWSWWSTGDCIGRSINYGSVIASSYSSIVTTRCNFITTLFYCATNGRELELQSPYTVNRNYCKPHLNYPEIGQQEILSEQSKFGRLSPKLRALYTSVLLIAINKNPTMVGNLKSFWFCSQIIVYGERPTGRVGKN